MKLFLQTVRIQVFSVFLIVLRCANGATGDFPPTPDPAFATGLATLKQAAGFIEDLRSSTDWKPNLHLLVGVKAVEGSKRIIYFVQLTTLPPPATNSGVWQPALRTNDWAWSPSNKAQFVSALYPVRVRVFDETGRQLKEGQTPMAWGMLTNGLLDMCRLGFEAYHNNNRSAQPQPLAPPSSSSGAHPLEKRTPAERLKSNPSDPSSEDGRGADGERVAATPGAGKESDTPELENNEELMRATGGGFLWMFGMLYDLQTVPAVANVWAKARCAIRWPSAWTVAKSLVTGFALSLEPRLQEVTNAATVDPGEPLYCLPVDLKSGRRHLTRVVIAVGPAHGAQMLLAGIRSIHARHPTQPKQEFLAQVLAAGTAEEK